MAAALEETAELRRLADKAISGRTGSHLLAVNARPVMADAFRLLTPDIERSVQVR